MKRIPPPIIAEPQIKLSEQQNQAIRTLSYFDVFQYPLTAEEICRFSKSNINSDDLNELVTLKIIKNVGDDFYGLEGAEIDIRIRLRGNDKARNLEKKAIRKANFIGQFPFVRSVCISGSMSKGYMGDDADLDFFIITQPGRLWVARTLLIFYKKVFLLNSRKFFCINYLVDTQHLEIEEKNRFTATEIITLINVYGSEQFQDFVTSNRWAFDSFPNSSPNRLPGANHSGLLKRSMERMLKGKMGSKLDAYFMKLTFKRWERKFGNMHQPDFELAFKTRTYVSKHHPDNFQRKVLERSNSRLNEISEKFNLGL